MITAEMSFSEVMSILPQSVEIFKSFRLDCSCCQMADYENLDHGCQVHHVDLEELLDALNKVLTT